MAKTQIREKILSTAVKLLGDCGIRKLAQPLIAKTAGVPQGHITYYFPTRSDLLIAVADRSLEAVAQTIIKGASKLGLKPRESIKLVAPLIKDASRTRMLVGLLVESDENPDLRKKLQEQTELGHSLIGMALGKAPDSPEVEVVHAALLGMGLNFYLDDAKDAKEKVDEALKVLVKMFGGKDDSRTAR
jgi:AcrR family transcriptional regulator